MRRPWLAVGVIAGALGMLAGGAYAASTSVSMNAGDSMAVSCPNQLSNSGVSANAETVSCAPDTTAVPPTTTPPPPSGNCGLPAPAFCDTFDQPTVNGPANQRAGQLNGVVWGTSMNTGNQPGNGLSAPYYPDNITVSNGQVNTTVNDGGTVTSLAMYPRQPFDFANRTGTVVFDVSNDSQGNHAAWPEFWMSDQPVPDPFTHEGSWQSQPVNGFGIRFAGCDGVTCPGGQNYVGVDSAVVVRNGVVNDSFGTGGLAFSPNLGAVAKSGPGQINHYQITVAQNDIEVYGTDAFTPGQPVPPLVHLASIPNANLQFTRGLVWMEDAHYNGNKFNTQGTHTFVWDNVGFDGPRLPRDLGFDVPNPAPPNEAYQTPATVTVPAVSGEAGASGALLVFNYYTFSSQPITGTFNGQPWSAPYPADGVTFSPRTIAVPIPLADVVDGNNTVSFTSNSGLFDVMNIDLILQGAGG